MKTDNQIMNVLLLQNQYYKYHVMGLIYRFSLNYLSMLHNLQGWEYYWSGNWFGEMFDILLR